jgi:hypothetical protein
MRAIRCLKWLTAATLVVAACGSAATVSPQASMLATSALTSTGVSPTTNASSSPVTVVATSTTVAPTVPPSLETTTSPVSAVDAPKPTEPNAALDARHLDHAGLASGLPTAGDLSWLPPDATFENDSDLTSRLVEFDCSGTRTDVPSRQPSATDRRYISGQESLASITFYDVETVDDARTFMSGLDTYISCPSPPSTVVTFEAVNLNAPAQCDDAVVIRTHQPVSETIDAWCRVANLIAWIRLYPTGVIAAEIDSAARAPIPPTDDQAGQTMIVTAASLRAAWNAAS